MHPETTRRLAAHRQAELAHDMAAAHRAQRLGRPRPRLARLAWLRLPAVRVWLANGRPLPRRQAL